MYKRTGSAINHEATSENTFSFAGRAFDKQRTKLASQQLCDTVVATVGEKREATEPGRVQVVYKRLRSETSAARLVAAAAPPPGLAAAAAPAPPAAGLAAAAAPPPRLAAAAPPAAGLAAAPAAASPAPRGV